MQAGTALVMLTAGVLVAYGGAMEFVYFGPGTPQFVAGLVTVPTGLAASLAAARLWARGAHARREVVAGAILLGAGTAAGSGLDVMGGVATLVGAVGSLIPLLWSARARRSPEVA